MAVIGGEEEAHRGGHPSFLPSFQGGNTTYLERIRVDGG
jgi:hypothetical protein